MAGPLSSWTVFYHVIVIPIVFVVTWLSGFAETSPRSYGFPLAWKALVLTGAWHCPSPPSLAACFLIGPVWIMVYNWSAFVLDAGFYATLGYATILASDHFLGKWSSKSSLKSLFHRSNWKPTSQTLLRIFLLSTIASMFWIAYLLSSIAAGYLP